MKPSSPKEQTRRSDSWQDEQGRGWSIRFTPKELRRLASLYECDPNEVIASESGPVQKALRSQDPFELAELVWDFVEPQANSHSVTKEDMSGFGHVFWDGAIEAVEAAVVNFTHPSRRGTVLVALEKADEIQETVNQRVREKLEGGLDAGIDRLLSEVDRVLDNYLSPSAKGSPAETTTSATGTAAS